MKPLDEKRWRENDDRTGYFGELSADVRLFETWPECERNEQKLIAVSQMFERRSQMLNGILQRIGGFG